MDWDLCISIKIILRDMPRTTGLGVVDMSLPRVGVLIELSVSHPGSIFCSIKINNWNLISCLTILTLCFFDVQFVKVDVCQKLLRFPLSSSSSYPQSQQDSGTFYCNLYEFVGSWRCRIEIKRNRQNRQRLACTLPTAVWPWLPSGPSSEEMISHLLLCSQEEVITSLVESCAS